MGTGHCIITRCHRLEHEHHCLLGILFERYYCRSPSQQTPPYHAGDLASLSIIALGIFIYTCGTKNPQGYDALRFALTSCFFLCITLANPRILHAQCLNRLSDISYSIYLMHLPILYLTFKIASHFVDMSTISKTTFWSINLIAIPLITWVSTLTYIHIEKRFMSKKVNSATIPATPASAPII